MKKPLAVVAILAVLAVGLALYGARAEWWGRKPPAANLPPPPEPLPAMVERVDGLLAADENKQKAAGHTELGKPETLKRLLAAVDDSSQPVPLRQRALLLLARAQGHI